MDLGRITELGFEKSSKWKSMVLVVSFSKWWNLLIALQCYILFLVCLSNLAFHYSHPELTILRYVFDVFYFFEILFTISYRTNPRYRKLKHTSGRKWYLIVVDIMSIIPIELFYTFHYISKNSNADVKQALFQNRLLRIYRIFQVEYFYGITVTKYSQYILYMFILFLSKAVLVAHVLCCIWFNLEHSVPCDSKRFNCVIWHETNMANLVILNWSGKEGAFGKPWEHVLVSVGMYLGVVMIYGYFYPFALLVSMQLSYPRILYYDKYKKLVRFLQNMIDKSETRKQILENFLDAWQSTSDVSPLVNNIPLALKKEMFLDIYWEAFRHSELLRSVTRNCKRSLSLVMTTNHYHSGEVIEFKGQGKRKMMFLIEGTVQVMAEENETSPLLSFSSGTVIGELSLFLCINSQAIIKCLTYCEFQTLKMREAMEVLRDYPKDKKVIFHKLVQRIAMARYTQWRKNEFWVKESQKSLDVDSTVEDCVKWIKTQWGAIWEGQKRQRMIIKAVEEGQRIPSFHSTMRPEVKIEYISNYLELIVISDVFEEKKDAVCLRTAFPWSIDPSAPFLKIWSKIVLITSFIPVVFYPVCTAWLPKFPRAVYDLSYIISVIFQVDLAFKLFTAVKTRHSIHTQFVPTLIHKLKEPTFYFDVIAAFPSQIFIIGRYKKLKSYQIGLYLHPAIFKFHLFVTMKIPLGSYMTKMVFLKNCLLFIFMLYLFSEGIQIYLIGYEAYENETADNWINRFMAGRNNEVLRKYWLSVIKALVAAISIPDYFMYPDENTMLVLLCLTKYAFFFFFCYFLGDFYGTYIVRIFSQETFLILLKRIIKFLNSVQLPRKLENRLLKTVKFQWDYDNADYLSSEVPIVRSTPFALRQQIYRESAYKTLQSCRMFQEESLECLVAVMEKSFIVAVPAGSLLVSYAHTSHMISILHRGKCQISSFLAKDTVKSLGWPIVVSEGSAFPLLSSFCNVPAPVAVVTITDCELIMIHLDDLLGIFIDFDILKDVLDVLKELNLLRRLKEVKPGLIGMKSGLNRIKEPNYKDELRRGLKVLGALLNKCCTRKQFTSFKLINIWEGFFSVYLILISFFWPACFGILAYSSYILFPILIASKVIALVNILLSFRTPYYNKMGILVTHPLHCFYNYFSMTFIVDCICFLPLFTIYRYQVVDSMEKLPIWVVIFSFAQHLLKVLHIIEYFNLLENVLNSKYAVRMIKVILLTFIAFNMIINFSMYVFADWIYEEPYKIVGFHLPEKYGPDDPKLLAENSLLDYYIFVCFWMFCRLNTNFMGLNYAKDVQLYLGFVLNFFGTIFNFYLYCWIASNSLFTYLGETVFQEKINSFVKFLEMKDADEKVIEYALSYYNYEWSNTRGENLKMIFERLPTHLHEELVYPMYRKTLSKNDVFAHVDEGFYKILAKHLRPVYFNRGSVIIFQNEVHSDLYFLHKGKCFVYDWFLVLDRGSLIGDLKRTGLMENKIYALTHVELLKISSDEFFMIINNFENLERIYLDLIKKLENFLKCDVSASEYEIRPVDSKDVLHAFGLQGKTIGFEDESYFEETDKSSVLMRKTLRYKSEDKKKLFTIYPGTWQMSVFISLLQIDAFLTITVVSTLASFAALTWEAFFVMGILDFFWLLGILVSFRVGYIDKVKGDIVTDFKFVARKYVKRWDGFVLDLLALIPFELVYIGIVNDLHEVNSAWVSWLRVFRLFRGASLLKGIKMESRKLKTNHSVAYMHVIVYMVLFFILIANIFLYVAESVEFVSAKNPYAITLDQFFIFVMAFKQACREVSPSIIRGVLDYKFNLLEFARSENMPYFLVNCPTYLRISIMRDLYLHHLKNCPLFEMVDNIFLEQLLARMTREIYFSGQMIVEQYDIDHRLYFIDKGEVYVITQTKDKAYVEFVEGKMMNGESFGEAQGLWFSLPHAYTYRARTLVEVVVLHADDWMDLRRTFPRTAALILEKAKSLRII